MSYAIDSEALRIRRALETFITAQNGGDKRETKNKLWFLCLEMSYATWLPRLAFKALPRALTSFSPHVIEIKNDEYRDGVFTFVYYSLELDESTGRLVEWARTKSQPSSTETVLWEEANPLAAVFRTVDMFRDEPIDRNAETYKHAVPPLNREAIAETTRVLLAAAQERTLLDGELSHYAHMIDQAVNQSGFDGWCTASTHSCWLSEHGIAFELKIVEEEEREWDDDVHVTYELDVGYPSVFREKFTEPHPLEDEWWDERVTELWNEPDPVDAVLRFIEQFKWDPQPVAEPASPLESATLALVDAHENRGPLDPSLAADRLAEVMAAELQAWGGLIDGRCVVAAQSRFSVSTVERRWRKQIVAVAYKLWLDPDGGLCEQVTQTADTETEATLWTECDPVIAVKRYVETLRERAVMGGYSGVAETSARLVSLLRSPLEDDPEDFMREELGQLADAIADSLGIDPDRFGKQAGVCAGQLSARLDIHPFVWRNGDRIVVRYALDMAADEATITETVGGLPVNTLFAGTPLVAVSEFVTLLDDVL